MLVKHTVLSRFVPKQFGLSISIPLRLTSNQSVATAQVEPFRAEMARSGRRFYAQPGLVANALAPVQDMPGTATAAMFGLYNGEPASGKTYLVEGLGVLLASGTADVGATVVVGVAGPQTSAPAQAPSSSIASASGSKLGSKAVFFSNLVTSVTPSWFPLAGNAQSAGTKPGLGGFPLILTDGMFAVPPGYVFCMHVISGLGTTAKYLASPVWSELELDLE